MASSYSGMASSYSDAPAKLSLKQALASAHSLRAVLTTPSHLPISTFRGKVHGFISHAADNCKACYQ